MQSPAGQDLAKPSRHDSTYQPPEGTSSPDSPVRRIPAEASEMIGDYCGTGIGSCQRPQLEVENGRRVKTVTGCVQMVTSLSCTRNAHPI
jgi:hypothetical protein